MLLNSVNNSSKMPAFKAKRAVIDESSGLGSHLHVTNHDELKEFAVLDDDSLRHIASYEPGRKFENTKKGLLTTLFFVVPAVDTSMTFIAKNSNLSGKLSAGAKQAGRWAAVFATGLFVLGGVKRFVNKNFPAFDNADKKYPALSFCADFSAMIAGLAGLKALGKAGSDFASKYFPKKLAYLQNNIKNPLKNALNNSNFNKYIVERINSGAFGSVNGWGRSLKIVQTLAAPVILSAAILKGLNAAKHCNKEAFENYQALKIAQSLTRNALASEIDD